MAQILSNTRLRMTLAKFFGKYNVASGTVTTITAGAGITLTPNPILTTGTVAVTAPVTVPLGGTGQVSFGVGYVLFGDAANSIKSDAELFWNNTSKYLGIGGSPSYPLTVVDTVGTTGVDNYATFSNLAKTDNEPATNSVGILGGVTLDLVGGKVVANFAGVASRVRVINAGTGTQGANFTAVAGVEDTATWNTRIGYYVFDATVAAGAALTDQYGLYIPQLSAASGNNYAIFTAGTTPSFFNGNIRTASDAIVDGSVGIGALANPPLYPLHVEKSVAVTGAGARNVYSKLTATAADANGRNTFYSDLNATNVAGNVGTLRNYNALTTVSGAGGTSDVNYAFYSECVVGAGATLSNRYGFFFLDATNAGTLTSQVGLYIDELTAAGTNYAIYTVGTTPSRFDGPVLLTDMVTVGHANTPTREVDIEGTTRYRGIAPPAVSEVNSGTIYFDSALNTFMASINGSAYFNIVGSGGLTGSGTATKIAYWTGATVVAGAANIYTDAANHRFGIKVAAPAYPLDVDGDVNITTGSVIRMNASPIVTCTAVADDAVTIVGQNENEIGGRVDFTAVGTYALRVATGASNTAIGRSAGVGVTTGTGNTLVGRIAGDTLTTGSNNVLIGHDADTTANNLTNAVAIGYQASVSANDSMSLGNASMKVGIRTGTPNTALDVNGSVALRKGGIALDHGGLFSNISLPSNSLIMATWIDDDVEAASIGGFTGGVNGRIFWFYNENVNKTITIVDEDMASTDVNRIWTMTGADVVFAAGRCSAMFFYDDVNDRWFLHSHS